MMIGHKALIPVAGEPMVLRPLRALLASPEVGDIIVLTQDPGDLQPILPDDSRVRIRASRGTIAADHRRAARRPCRANSRCWSRPPTTRCSTRRWSPSSPPGPRAPTSPSAVVESRPLLARFPHTKRTWIGFRGGALQRRQPVRVRLAQSRCRRSSRGGAVEQDRKKGWRLLAALGPALLLGAVFKLRTIHDSAAAIGRKLGLDIRIVEMSNPLAAIDVDKPADHALVEAIIAGRA